MNQATAQYPSLKDRTVFITGGGSGIGGALTRAFHTQGAHVAFIDIDEQASQRLITELETETGQAPWFRRCDIRDIDSLQEAIRDAGQALGPIRVLVNNAANDDRHDWHEVDTQYWDDRMAINLRPLFLLSRPLRHR